MNKNDYHHRGLTLVETAIAGVVFVIVMVGVSSVLADSQRLWNTMYNRTYSNVVIHGHLTKKMFDASMRKASEKTLQIDSDGRWIEAQYYSDDTAAQPDRYVRFTYVGGALFAEHGQVEPREQLSFHTLCDNVTRCVFKQSGRSVHMLLTINDGAQTQTIGTSAELHN